MPARQPRCAECGDPIWPADTGRRAVWCSPRCRQAAWRREHAVSAPDRAVACGYCGAPLWAGGLSGRPAVWWRPACRQAAWRGGTAAARG